MVRSFFLLVLLAGIAPAQQLLFEKTLPLPASRIPLPGWKPGAIYSVTARTVGKLDSQLALEVGSGNARLAAKTLHAGDQDFTVMVRAQGAGWLTAKKGPAVSLKVRVVMWPAGAPVEVEPNDTWLEAQPIRLEQTIFGSADDAPYFPLPGSPLKKAVYEQAPDWFRFEFAGPPKLVFFQLDLAERDNVPADVAVFRVVNGLPVAYNDGEDPVTLPHEVQAMQGNKFTTRVLREAGTYYVRVVANHPEYKLRTRVYGVPPYTDPRQAVQTALDYAMGAGDSWHANTPRRGGVYDRVASVHQETSLCVACHVTHFSQRAQLYAMRQGYPVHQRQQLQFMTERFYNNPRPLYGFEEQGAVWARVISAPANVLGRMSHLLDLFEQETGADRRENFHRGVREYLKLYYQDRTKLPPDETNGNQPLVSTYEVAWYAWELTKDPQLENLLVQTEHKNLIDLCYQTQALVSINPTKHATRIQQNVDRILSLQRPSGQWSMKFAENEKEVEFQTGHALWTLAMAGVPKEHPRVAKGLTFLLGRQQEFGGWLDPLQSFENFRTPFRETQMAALALATYYPREKRIRGWGTGDFAPQTDLLTALDSVWDQQTPAAVARITALTQHADPFIRQQAVEALGRLALPVTLTPLLGRLGDDSKLVQRTAAWAIRQVESRHPLTPAPLIQALDSPEPRVRWGATRIFATHFAALATSPDLAIALARRVNDPEPAVATQAIKGLWQFWFWSPSESVKSGIEDALLAGLAKPQGAWAEQALREGVYNLTDENIRYLYNNWVPAIAREADQKRVIAGRLKIEARLAGKFARFLETQPDTARKRLLAGLVELPLRRADIYDPTADSGTPFVPVYNRIGNDVEQSVFFGESNTRFATALLPLVSSADPELRRLALGAAQLTRDARFGAVTAISGPPGAARDQLVAAAKKDLRAPENAELLKAFNQFPRPPAPAKGTGRRPNAARPDEAFYRGYVEPIFLKRGKDGYACVQCHASHAAFNATLSTVFSVVNLEDPEESLLLKKPTWTAEAEGTIGAQSHGGGVRFEKDSPEYTTILNWLRGVKE
ncbi:MAG: HEAT repeat domain-containing protein [Bryobacteraceae bacterium]|nr:HEAT repeat domain-containing protein [Bryobacteraceae bacterium]